MSTEIKRVDYQNSEQANAVVLLLNHYSMDPMGASEPLPDIVQQNLISELQKREHFGSAIVYVDQQPAALVNFAEGFSTFAAKPLINVHDLVVHREYRGKGLSQMLLDFVIGEAKKIGCCKVTLEVLGGNEVAKNAYKKFGFAPYRLSEESGVAEFWQMKLS
jgi:GNAT superfamily N-acetyltransferase